MSNNTNIIKQKIKISDYIDPTTLTKTTQGWKCLSPLSAENTPSFYIKVNPDGSEIFKCFSTGKAGDIFEFLMEFQNKTFVEVFNELAEKVGIKTRYSKIKTASKIYIETLEKINTHAMFNLKENSEVLDYIINTRKIPESFIDLFKLGFIKDGIWPIINQQNLDKTICRELGLIMEGETGFYDVIKNRITIPLFSKNQYICGLSNRRFLETDTYSKYVNPPNNLVFKKNTFLYGLNWSQDEIKKEDKVILVEGYFDFMKLYANDIKNVVALNGTTIMSSHVKDLIKLTNKFYICTDADSAGKNSIVRNAKELIKSGCEIFIVNLEDGEDPDSFIDKYGAKEFNTRVNNASNFLDFINSQKEQMIPLLEELKEIILKLASDVRKQYWIQNIKTYTGINIGNKINIKTEYYNKQKETPISVTDTEFLKLYVNATDDDKVILIQHQYFETEKAKLIFLKLINTTYKIDFTEPESLILESIKLKSNSTKKEIDEFIEKIRIKKLLNEPC